MCINNIKNGRHSQWERMGSFHSNWERRSRVPKALVLVNISMKLTEFETTKSADDADFFNVIKTSEL